LVVASLTACGTAHEAPKPAAPAKIPQVEEPPPKAAETYELARDLEERREEATRDFGKRVDLSVVEGVFLLVAPGERGALSGTIDFTKRALAAYFNGRFKTRPSRAISVYLFPNAGPYHGFCRRVSGSDCISRFGFYDYRPRRIVMNIGPGAGTLTHELVHPLVEADFPSAPTWINEGIASLFEAVAMPRPGEIRGFKNWRWPRLVRALDSRAEREHATLPALFGISDEAFRGELEDLNYASARYLCQWLDGKDLLWPFYQRWRDTFDTDPTGEKAFTEIVGRSPAAANADWQKWVRRL